PPGGSAQPVAELDLLGAGPVRWPEAEPPQEVPGGLLYGRPEAIPGGALVVAEEAGQDVALDHVAGGGRAAGEVAHDLGVAVEVDQVVRVGRGEPAQDQALGFQEDLHPPTPSHGTRPSSCMVAFSPSPSGAGTTTATRRGRAVAWPAGAPSRRCRGS